MLALRRQRSLSADLVIVAVASTIALALRENFSIDGPHWRAFFPYLLYTLAVAGPIIVVLELDRSVWRFSGLADYVRAAIAAVLIVIGATAIGFIVNRLDGIARSLPVLQAVVIAVGLVGVRVFTRLIHSQRQQTSTQDPVKLPSMDDTVLLVGWGNVTQLFIRSVAELSNGSIHIAGILSPQERQVGRLVQSVRVLGTPEDIRSVLADLDVHGIHVGRVIIATAFDRLSENARRVLREVESTTDVRLDFLSEQLGLVPHEVPPAADGRRNQIAGVHASAAGFAVDSAVFAPLLQRPYWRLKRLVDATVALVLMIVLLPLTMLVAFLVAVDVGLPTLFVQQRPGLRGRRFNLYKFRTMAAAHDSRGRRVPDEARISAVGKFLRRTRLDELPQLYNIFIGDMAFVGPRPLVTKEQSPDIAARLLVRPGLTGWAQVIGGRVVTVEDKAALDVWYVQQASFRLDLRIIAATVPMVLFGERVDRSAVRQAWLDLRALGIREPARAHYEAEAGLPFVRRHPAV